jgi:hypothetical protein
MSSPLSVTREGKTSFRFSSWIGMTRFTSPPVRFLSVWSASPLSQPSWPG